ncbi:MAG: hypothetical protein ACE15D_18740 [Candidatus Eisenbacteria bacterium]
MGRLAHVDELLAQLHGVNLDVLRWTGFGDSDAQLRELLEGEILEAEAWAEDYCNRSFTPLASHVDILSGRGQDTIRLRHVPIVDVQQLEIRSDAISDPRAFTEAGLRIRKDLGTVAIKPGPYLPYAMPFGSRGIFAFPRGEGNIVVQYRTGWVQIGDNVAVSTLADAGHADVAHVHTDATYAWFDCPKSFALAKAGQLVSTRPPLQVLKNGVDDSATWTMVSSRQLRCPIASYTATATYLFAYVPAAVGQAVAKAAAACVLKRKGTVDHPSSAQGATSLGSGPWREDYGEYQFAGHVKAFEADAEALLRNFRRGSVT